MSPGVSFFTIPQFLRMTQRRAPAMLSGWGAQQSSGGARPRGPPRVEPPPWLLEASGEDAELGRGALPGEASALSGSQTPGSLRRGVISCNGPGGRDGGSRAYDSSRQARPRRLPECHRTAAASCRAGPSPARALRTPFLSWTLRTRPQRPPAVGRVSYRQAGKGKFYSGKGALLPPNTKVGFI